MTKYFTIPGYGGSGEGHWQTYFDNTLDNCQRIHQDSWTKPILDDWVERINEILSKENLEDTILITHSLGGIALLKWVKKYKQKIKGALLVAPPDIENPYQDLGLGDIQIPQLRLPFPSVVVCSTNDPWMTEKRTKHFAEIWGSEFIVLKNAGHINADSGYGAWDEGLNIVKTLG